MAERFPDGSTLRTEIYKDADRVLRISREVDHGRVRIKFREWFKDENGEWRPDRAGVDFKRDQAPAVVSGILRG